MYEMPSYELTYDTMSIKGMQTIQSFCSEKGAHPYISQ